MTEQADNAVALSALTSRVTVPSGRADTICHEPRIGPRRTALLVEGESPHSHAGGSRGIGIQPKLSDEKVGIDA